MALDLMCTSEEKIKVTAVPSTSGDNPAMVDGGLQVEVALGDGTFELNADGDPLSVFLISGSGPGDTSYVIGADADLGAGVVLIQDTATLHVINPFAASLGLTASAPVPK